MNDDNKQEVTTGTMRALRDEPDALRVITARLRAKEMGPADHIRTKHEVKAWLLAGGDDLESADDIIRREEQVEREAIRMRQSYQVRQTNGDELG